MTGPLRIGLLGLGTVGAEVARGLTHERARLAAASGGRGLHLVMVADPDPARPRGIDLPGIERVADGNEVVGCADVDVVVELIGGTGIAGDLVSQAIGAGKSVVTANKALLARRGPELERLARAEGAAMRFEAAVGGGIPILAALGADLAANRWTSLRGIVNGSTNFVLTAMTETKAPYEEIVAQAQSRGILEADPSTDLEGRDGADKLAILIRLAFGTWPDVTAIRRAPPALEGDGLPGIAGVSARLIEVARRDGFVIRLVAHARLGDDGRITAFVLPAALRADDPLARTTGVENRIEMRGEPVGSVAFVGPGAGGSATSSAVLGDLLALARGEGSTWAGLPDAPVLPANRLIDGMDAPRTWVTCDLPGEGGLTSRVTLAELRAQLAGSGQRAALFPVLDEA